MELPGIGFALQMYDAMFFIESVQQSLRGDAPHRYRAGLKALYPDI
jgi:hypothetical protein